MAGKTIELGFAKFSLSDDGIIRLVYAQGVEITLREVEKGAEAIKELCQGVKRPMFVDGRGIKHMNREARLHSLQKDSATPLISAIASVNKPLLTMLGALFVNLIKPPYPLKLFSTESEAIEWLKNFLE
jgi:hypothetical protein